MAKAKPLKKGLQNWDLLEILRDSWIFERQPHESHEFVIEVRVFFQSWLFPFSSFRDVIGMKQAGFVEHFDQCQNPWVSFVDYEGLIDILHIIYNTYHIYM